MAYYNSDKIITFPSSNSTNKGKITQESNLRDITNKLKLNNYVVSGMEISRINLSTIQISEGVASVGGYLITTTEPLSISISGQSFTEPIVYVYLKLNFDTVGNLDTNRAESVGLNCGVEFITSVDLPSEDDVALVLGEFDLRGMIIKNYPTYPISISNVSTSNQNVAFSDYLDDSFVSSINDDDVLGTLTFKNGETQSSSYTTEINEEMVKIKDTTTDIKIVSDGIVGDYNNNEKFKLSVTSGGFDISSNDKEIFANSEGIFAKGSDSVELKVAEDNVRVAIGNKYSTFDSNAFSTDTVKVTNISPTSNTVTVTSDLYINGNTNTSFLTVRGNATVNANIVANGTITGSKVYNAVYNDGVEFMEKSDRNEIIVSGDVVCFDDNGKVTKIKNSEDAKRLVGVVSSEETYGYALGGDGLDEDEKVPIGLFGRVFVNVPFAVNVGDLIAIKQDGSGLTKTNVIDRYVIGKVTKNSNDGRAYIKIMN